MINYADGRIEKGEMENNLRQGIWELFYPAQKNKPAYWCKQEYIKGEKLGYEYVER